MFPYTIERGNIKRSVTGGLLKPTAWRISIRCDGLSLESCLSVSMEVHITSSIDASLIRCSLATAPIASHRGSPGSWRSPWTGEGQSY